MHVMRIADFATYSTSESLKLLRLKLLLLVLQDVGFLEFNPELQDLQPDPAPVPHRPKKRGVASSTSDFSAELEEEARFAEEAESPEVQAKRYRSISDLYPANPAKISDKKRWV